jgi:hypothetical protein
MDIRADAPIPFPRDLVFATYRDDMAKVVSYLPNVRSIQVTSRKENGAVVEMVNEWRGGGDIPAAIRAVLSESALAWTDYASWDSSTFRCDWRTQTHSFSDALVCRGSNLFAAEGNATRLEIRGSLELDPKKIRGVPSFLAGKVGKAVEEFLVGKISSNLLETAKGLSKYLEEQGKARTAP